jgi:hypothetical protein
MAKYNIMPINKVVGMVATTSMTELSLMGNSIAFLSLGLQ